MALALISNTDQNDNIELLAAISKRIGDNRQVAFIPSSHDPGHKSFKKYCQTFFNNLDVEVDIFGLEPEDWQKSYPSIIATYPAVFLSGGNTFHFMHWIKQRKLQKLLAEFATSKLYVGFSAGAIIATPRTDIARDQDDYNQHKDGLNLTNFYFTPHFTADDNDIAHIEDYKKKLPHQKRLPVYACPDQCGVIVDDGKVEVYGEVKVY